MDIRFGDHASFHRAAAGMVGGSLPCGLALHPVTPTGAAARRARSASPSARRSRYGKADAGGSLAAGAARVPLLAMTRELADARGRRVGGGARASRSRRVGRRGMRGVLAVAARRDGDAARRCGARCGSTTARADDPTWPRLVRDGVAAAAMGMVGVLAMLPRHLTRGARSGAGRACGTCRPGSTARCATCAIARWRSGTTRRTSSPTAIRARTSCATAC